MPTEPAVEGHREALEALVEHGKTELAEDARELLKWADNELGG